MGPFSKKSDEQESAQTDTSSVNNVSNDTSPREPVTPVTTEPVVKKEKHSKAFSFVSVLFLLMLLVAGVMTYMWYDQKSQAESLSQDVNAAEKTVSDLRASISKMNADADAGETGPVTTDDNKLISNYAASKYYADVNVKNPDPTFAVKVSKLELPFARVSVGSNNAGASCIYKKVVGTWVELYCYQNITSETDALNKQYGVPDSLLKP